MFRVRRGGSVQPSNTDYSPRDKTHARAHLYSLLLGFIIFYLLSPITRNAKLSYFTAWGCDSLVVFQSHITARFALGVVSNLGALRLRWAHHIIWGTKIECCLWEAEFEVFNQLFEDRCINVSKDHLLKCLRGQA